MSSVTITILLAIFALIAPIVSCMATMWFYSRTVNQGQTHIQMQQADSSFAQLAEIAKARKDEIDVLRDDIEGLKREVERLTQVVSQREQELLSLISMLRSNGMTVTATVAPTLPSVLSPSSSKSSRKSSSSPSSPS